MALIVIHLQITYFRIVVFVLLYSFKKTYNHVCVGGGGGGGGGGGVVLTYSQWYPHMIPQSFTLIRIY